MQNEIKYGSKGKSLALRLKSPERKKLDLHLRLATTCQYPISISEKGNLTHLKFTKHNHMQFRPSLLVQEHQHLFLPSFVSSD